MKATSPCIRAIAREHGVLLADYGNMSLAAACAAWCSEHSAQIVTASSPAVGLAVVTVAMPEGAQRTVEFVLAVG